MRSAASSVRTRRRGRGGGNKIKIQRKIQKENDEGNTEKWRKKEYKLQAMEMEARGNGSSTSEALLQDRLLRLDALLRVRRFYRTFERSESLIRAREIAISTSPDCSQWRLGYDAEDTDWPLISKLVGASRALRRDSVVLRTEYKGLTRSGAMEYLFLPVGGKRLVKPETLTVDEADEILKVDCMPRLYIASENVHTFTHRARKDTEVDNANLYVHVCAKSEREKEKEREKERKKEMVMRSVGECA